MRNFWWTFKCHHYSHTSFEVWTHLTLFKVSIFVMLSDNVKKTLVQQGYGEHLVKIISSLMPEQSDEYVKQRVQSSADMIVMLLTEGWDCFVQCFNYLLCYLSHILVYH